MPVCLSVCLLVSVAPSHQQLLYLLLPCRFLCLSACPSRSLPNYYVSLLPLPFYLCMLICESLSHSPFVDISLCLSFSPLQLSIYLSVSLFLSHSFSVSLSLSLFLPPSPLQLSIYLSVSLSPTLYHLRPL